MNESRILVIGGDASVRLAITGGFPDPATRMFVPIGITEPELFAAATQADLILVSCTSEIDGVPVMRLLSDLGLQRSTVVIADAGDEETAAHAVAMGIAGFVSRRQTTRHLLAVMQHVLAGGVVLDGAAADAFVGRIDPEAYEPDAQLSAARALAFALEMKDAYTGGHAERVSSMAICLADAASLDGAAPDEVLETAFLLHDVGKIGIPEAILGKPSDLTGAEARVMRTHPILGERVIEPLGFPSPIRDVVRHHHERWDGNGYPDRLAGPAIPTSARLFAIADAIDAMTSRRPYRDPVPFEVAVDEVVTCSGTHFDPDLAHLAREIFLEAPPVLEAQ